MSLVTSQLLDFFEFILIGIIISIIFDFFRAYRSARKTNDFIVLLQDFIYFFLVTVIIIISIINILDSNLRGYVFLAIILGIFTYISLLSKFFLKIYDSFFKSVSYIFNLIMLPLKLFMQIFIKIYIFFKKIIKKCCKNFLYMVSLICRKFLNIKFSSIKFKRRGLKKV